MGVKRLRKRRRKMTPKKINWSVRYSAAWIHGKVQGRIHRETGDRCCLCHTRKSVEVHHAEYKNFLGKVRDFENESKGVSLFPVCEKCHKILHSKRNWKYDSKDPVFGSCNTPEIKKRLRLGYKILSVKD